MEIITLISNKGLANTYIIKNNNSCVIVDCGVSVDAIKNKVGNHKVEAILLTHAHFDHIYYLSDYLNEFNCFVYGSENCLEKFDDPYKNVSYLINQNVVVNIDKELFCSVKDNQKLQFEDLSIEVISLCGHSCCGMGYIVDNNLFCGDVLFKESVGRYDLWDSNELELNKSLEKIYSLAPINIYCGHADNFLIKKEEN